MVRSSVTSNIDVTIFRDVIHEPGNFIGVGFDDNLVFGLWINNTNNGSVRVNQVRIDIWFDIVQPDLLT